MELSVLIVLLYFNRPKMVRNAYHSICRMEYDNWKLAVIDDGSTPPGKEVLLQEMKGYIDKVKYYNTNTTLENKLANKTKLGEYMNEAIKAHETDLVVVLCDDDAMYARGLNQLNVYYQRHPKEMYAYSHVIEYNPEKQWYADAKQRTTWHNRLKEPTFGSCVLDSSQVSFRRLCFTQGNIWFSNNITSALDADLFERVGDKYGKAHYTDGILQYKGIFSDQMGNRRDNDEHMFMPTDKVPE